MKAHSLAAALCLLSITAAAAGTASSQEWPTFHGGASLEGSVDIDFSSGLEERWRLLIGDPPSGTPVGGGGRIYVATEEGLLFALALNGREVWQTRAGTGGSETERERFAAPPLLAGDTVVLGSRLGGVYAFERATGKMRWRFDIGGPVFGTANVLPPDDEGRRSIVVLSQADGAAHRIDLASGKSIMTSEPTNRCDGSAAVRGDTIAYGNCDAALFFLSASDMKVKGRIDLFPEGQVFAGVALTDEAVYAGDRSGRIYAADPSTGRVLWVNEESEGDISSTPAVHGDRVVYSSDDGTVAALDRGSGRTLWRSAIGGRPTEPVITSGGQVLVSVDGSLVLLHLSDGSTLWSREVSDEITSPAVIGGMIVVVSEDGFVVGFGAEE